MEAFMNETYIINRFINMIMPTILFLIKQLFLYVSPQMVTEVTTGEFSYLQGLLTTHPW